MTTVPAYSPLPSTSTMPLSLQQLSSAASSTDSLDGPTNSASNGDRTPASRHYHSSSKSSGRTEPYPIHVTQHPGQVTLAHADPARSDTAGKPARTASAAVYELRRPALSPTSSSAYDTGRRNEGSPSIYSYSASSTRSTSSVNSLPPASESSLSTSTVMFPHTDPKGRGKTAFGAVSTGKPVASEIAEAVRNLGLAPPGISTLQGNAANSPYLSVPNSRMPAGSPLHLSRTTSANTSTASISDVASLSGTVASSIASTSQDAQSVASQKSAAGSKTKKKKKVATPLPVTTTTTVISSSSSARPPAAGPAHATSSPASLTEQKPKKKKKKVLPTSSGKPPTSAGIHPTQSQPTSPAPASPPPVARPAQGTRSTRTARNAATSPTPVQASSSTVPTPHTSTLRPIPQAVAPSRNRHLDESALLRRFPNTASSFNSPVPPTGEASQRVPAPASQASRPSPQATPSIESRASEPPPPPWSAPLETITLAFTPIHAYLSAYHDSADQPAASTTQTSSHPLVPDSPPPAFRSRSPSPEAGPSDIQRGPRTHLESALADDSLPEIDLDTLEERSRGYASSENEVDLLTTQGKHSGTSTPPLDGAHGDSTKGLRWQVRHWEAWRREGVSLEDRLLRLQQWNTNAQAAASVSAPSQLADPALDERSEEARPSESAPHSQPAQENLLVPQVGLAPSPHITPSDRRTSPARSDVSPQAGSGVSQPRFPSVGTVRRARLQRFEAERQHTKSMATVVQNSPATSNVEAPKRKNSQAAAQDASASPAATSAPDADEREQVRLAVLQAAMERRPSEEVASPKSRPQLRQVQPEQPFEVHDDTTQSEVLLQEGGISLAIPAHQLARQLAAEVESRQSGTPPLPSSLPESMTSPQQAISARGDQSVASGSQAAQVPPTASEVQSPGKSTTEGLSNQKPLQKAASRISRIFRPNMGPRSQSPRKANAPDEQPAGHKVVTPRVEPQMATPTVPVMTLPKAPPRLTTDPLSTDNLRKLSRHQLRSPSIHGAASASSSSEEDDASTSSTSEPQKSDSGSDSADDESTKKPASTISHIGGRVPPSIAASTVYAQDSDREAAAASWRRTEDGRRHSAILSRPLSIKRKPPPVPPKRWGGVWDREAIQDRLRKSFNLLDEDGREIEPDRHNMAETSWFSNTARQVMPGTLASVAEDEPAWEVVGQETNTAPSIPTATWEVVGQSAPISSITRPQSRFVAPASSQNSARQSIDDTVKQHTYSEADFSTSRRPPPPPPPPPRFGADSAPSAQVSTSLGPSEDLTSSNVEKEYGSPVMVRGSSLQRAPAVRRPQSMMGSGQQRRQSFQSAARESPDGARSSPPSPEVRSRLSTRPRHVYSASVPNATQVTAPTAAGTGHRRPLPPLPMSGNATPHPAQSSTNVDFTQALGNSTEYRSPTTPVQSQVHEYTDLEVMLSTMDHREPGTVSPSKARFEGVDVHLWS